MHWRQASVKVLEIVARQGRLSRSSGQLQRLNKEADRRPRPRRVLLPGLMSTTANRLHKTDGIRAYNVPYRLISSRRHQAEKVRAARFDSVSGAHRPQKANSRWVVLIAIHLQYALSWSLVYVFTR